MTEIRAGDKVICLYRKQRPEGRLHLGVGKVTHMARTKDNDPHFFTVCLDRIDNEKVTVMNMFPYGAIALYDDELFDKVRVFHNQIIRSLEDIEKEYFDMFGMTSPRKTREVLGRPERYQNDRN